MNRRQDPEQTDWREVECAVLAYLAQHPDAADTLEGIVSWWLPTQRYETERQYIEKALDLMVERGLLCRDRLPGGTVLYALKHIDHSLLH
jgi:hypothetical protein